LSRDLRHFRVVRAHFTFADRKKPPDWQDRENIRNYYFVVEIAITGNKIISELGAGYSGELTYKLDVHPIAEQQNL
jgi:hypothetical protein